MNEGNLDVGASDMRGASGSSGAGGRLEMRKGDCGGGGNAVCESAGGGGVRLWVEGV